MTTKILNFALEELENIIDQIKTDDTPYFSDSEAIELYDTCLYLMEEFIKKNPKIITEPDFEDIFDDNIEELMLSLIHI